MFLHPWAIALGIVAAALPVAVHFLTRPRPTRMPLSTLRFVREAVQQRRARHRLRDLVVLALRTAAVLLVALAIARPQWGEQPLVSDLHAGSAVRVVILDVSQSMAAMDRGVQGIERARTAAAEHLRYRPGMLGNLIVAAAQPRAIFGKPSQNFEALRDELSRASVEPQQINVNRALALAAEMLTPTSDDDHRRRELVVVSDFQRANWAQADFSPLPTDTQIQLESTAPATALSNLAVMQAGVRGQSSLGSSTRLEVAVGNFSPTPRRAKVEVQLGDATYRLEGACPAGRVTTLGEEIQLRQPGWQWGQARLLDADDALAADDQRAVVVEVRASPVFALLTQQQSDSQGPNSSHYLEWALVPDSQLGDRASAKVVRVDPSQADSSALGPADLIVIDHPGKLSNETVQLLAGLLRRGRPLIYVAAEAIDATNLRQLADAAGSGLQMPVDFQPPPQGQARQDLFLTSVRHDAPPFAVFGDSATAIVGRLRFAGGLSSRHLDDALQDDLLASYNDGTACLVLTSSDAGSLAVLNADLNRSNLPLTDAFVPLLDELVQRLLERGQNTRTAVCGEPLVMRLPATAGTAGELKVAGPDGAGDAEAAHGELVDEGFGVVWNWPAPDAPGVYRVQHADKTVCSVAVHAPDEESRLESLAADVLQERLSGGRAVYFHAAAEASQTHDSFWTWLAVACVVCILGEIVSLAAFRT